MAKERNGGKTGRMRVLGLEPRTYEFKVRCSESVSGLSDKDLQSQQNPTDTKTAQNPAIQGVDNDQIQSVDPQLVAVVKAWPTLPEHIRAAIKALVQTSMDKHE